MSFCAFWLVWRVLLPALPGPDDPDERIARFARYFTDPLVTPLARTTRLPARALALALLLVTAAARWR